MRYKKSYANKTLDAYIAEVEELRDRIDKDFTDMDFANASARNEMEDIIRRMMAECDRLISDIRMKKI
ncbi:MAG: hypothetical protein K2O73_06080 [Lachnospiraceae bacterium]|nr:hypothetical protein [Lachnospiraceae bacterium]